ncbi:hypothetical protein [Bradyrhizobium sp. USDA 3315]
MVGRMIVARIWTGRRPLANRRAWFAMVQLIAGRTGNRPWRAIPLSLFWRRRRAPLQFVCNGVRREISVERIRTDLATGLVRQLPAVAPPSVTVLREIRAPSGVSASNYQPPGPSLPTPSHRTEPFRPVWRNQIIHHRVLAKPSIVARPSPLAERRATPLRTLRERLSGIREVLIVHKSGKDSAAISPLPGNGGVTLRLTRSRRRSIAAGSIPLTPATVSNLPVPAAAEFSETSQRRAPRPAERQLRAFGPQLRPRQVERSSEVSIDLRPRQVSLVWRKHSGQAGHPLPATNAHHTSGPVAAALPANAITQQAARNIPAVPASANQPRRDAAAAIDPVFAGRLADDVMRRIDQRLRIERERRGL